MKRKNFEVVSSGISAQELSAIDMLGIKGGVICTEDHIICIENECSLNRITLPCVGKQIVIN